MSELVWFKSSYSSGAGGNCVEVALEWRKSTHSGGGGGECVEVAMDWRKSSHSGGAGGQCVEVANTSATVHVRDSKDPNGPTLTFTPAAWTSFLTFARTHHHHPHHHLTSHNAPVRCPPPLRAGPRELARKKEDTGG